MLKLIHGDNYYQDLVDLEKIKAENTDKEVSVVEGDMIQDVGEIFVNNESFGLFNNSNLTIVKRFFKNSKKISLEKKIIEKLQKSDVENTHLIFWEDKNIFSTSTYKAKSKAKSATAKKPRATSKLNTFLKNTAEVKQNDVLDVPHLISWVKAEFKVEKIEISSQMANNLVIRVGTNQSVLANEIEKLKLWCRANPTETITNTVLDEVTILYEQDYQSWDLTDAFFAKNKVKALKILERLLINPQQDFPMIIGSVLRQLKIIYVVKKYGVDSQTVMSRLRLIPFVFSKAQKVAQGYSLIQIKKMYQKFIDLDYSIKLGKIDVKLGLDLLIITLT